MKIEKVIISFNKKVSDEYFLLGLESPSIASHVRAGQFLLVQAEVDTTNPLLKIPLAIYDKTPKDITVLCRIRGQKTNLLSQKTKGQSIEILGPLGNSFDSYPLTKTAILVAGGCGIASLYLLAKKLREKNVSVLLLSGARCKDELIEIERFEALKCKVSCATDDGSQGFRGDVVELFLKTKKHSNFRVYAAGPEAMLRRIATLATTQSFDAQLSFESYMACGIGVCRGCAVKVSTGYQLCCQQGPIFQANEII